MQESVTLSLELVYNDDKVETQRFYFEKDDSYSDIVLGDEPHINKSGFTDVVVSFEIENFAKLLYPKKISVKSSREKECVLYDDRKTDNIYRVITIPFEPDGLDRNYTVTIPQGTILLDNGLNNEYVFEVKNEIEYVVPENFLLSVSPVEDHIKYISGEQEDITITIQIKNGFKVDESKDIYFDRQKVEYTTKIGEQGTTLTFVTKVNAGKKHNVEFGEGLIIGTNGETNGPKHNYNFTVVDKNTINVPEKAIFTDVPTDHWAYEHITQFAIDDIISGYNDKTFKPNGFVTRGELAKLLDVLFNVSREVSYYDSQDHWAYDYILSVGGFIPSEGKYFKPDEYATRQDVTVALVNIIESENVMKMQEGDFKFVDAPMIDEEYISHIG